MDGVSRFRRWRLVVGVAIVTVLALSTASWALGASSPFQNVIIANPADNPIPVTGTVVTGAIKTLPVSGTVNVGNFPAEPPRTVSTTASCRLRVDPGTYQECVSPALPMNVTVLTVFTRSTRVAVELVGETGRLFEVMAMPDVPLVVPFGDYAVPTIAINVANALSEQTTVDVNVSGYEYRP
jgi:hypothetical protein